MNSYITEDLNTPSMVRWLQMYEQISGPYGHLDLTDETTSARATLGLPWATEALDAIVVPHHPDEGTPADANAGVRGGGGVRWPDMVLPTEFVVAAPPAIWLPDPASVNGGKWEAIASQGWKVRWAGGAAKGGGTTCHGFSLPVIGWSDYLSRL